MTAAYLWAWDATPGAEQWRKVLVNNEGKLIIDPAEILDYPMKLEPNTTRWVIPGWYCDGSTTRAVAASWIYYIPIFVEKTTIYIRIGIQVTAASVGNADLRIFNWENGLPTSLVLSAGTVNTGAIGLKEIIIAQALTRGYYFLAVRCTGTPTLRCPDPTAAIKLPVAGIGLAQNLPYSLVIMRAFAAYADPAPAPTAIGRANYATVQLREN